MMQMKAVKDAANVLQLSRFVVKHHHLFLFGNNRHVLDHAANLWLCVLYTYSLSTQPIWCVTLLTSGVHEVLLRIGNVTLQH